MKKLDANLSQIFDIQPIIKEDCNTEIITVDELDSNQDLEADFNTARTNIKELLRKSDGAIDELLKVANESEHPRAYEVAATLIKTMADLNKDLLDIRKKKNDIGGKPTVENNTNIDKAVFIGSTSDLIKILKDKKED
jgi:predicted house-cleaning noncanonical NTP pyrophosphatase (MazG superfamily)